MGTQHKITVVAACLIMSAMVAGTVSFGFFMDPVTSDLGFERSTFSLYFSLITVVGTLTLPMYGKLIDRFGARPFVIAGGVWTGVAMAAFSLCDSLPTFYGVGVLVGLGFFGCSYAAVPVIVTNWFEEKQGFVMGLAAACGGIVAMILSLVFPSFITANGWRAGYVLLGVVVLCLTAPVGLALLHSKPSDVGLQAHGATEHDATGKPNVDLSGVAYRDALSSPRLWVLSLAFLLLAITVTITQHLAAHFVNIGFDPVMAGVFMSVISGGLIITSSVAGVASDKLGLQRAFLIASALYLASFIILPASSLIPVICVALFLMSIGNANTAVFAPVITGAVFGQRDYAAIWGIVSMANVLGQAVGAPLWGLAYDITGGYEIGMYVSAFVVAASFLMLAWVQKKNA